MTTPTTVQVRFQFRADTAANWTTINPVLLANELARETDTGKIKIGDGTTAWSSLAYQGWSTLTYPLVNADIASDAAIDHSKLADITAGSVLLGNASDVPTATALSGDVTVNSSGVTAISAGAIVDADVSASAEIAVSKLANGSANQILTTDGTNVSWTDNPTIAGNVIISGNLTVNGTETIINVDTLQVEDKTIEMGVVTTPTDLTANGGGIVLKGTTDKTITWSDTTDAWTSSEPLDLPAGAQATPSLFFGGDVNSGLYSPGADQVAISTAGEGRLFVNSSGVMRHGSNAGGTYNGNITFAYNDRYPAIEYRTGNTVDGRLWKDVNGGNFLLENVTGSIVFEAANSEALRLTSTGEFEFTGAGTAGTSQAVYFSGSAPVDSLVIASNGRVGLGTSSPDQLLDLQESSTGSAPGPFIRFTDGYSGAWTANTDSAGIEFYSADASGPGIGVRSKIANTVEDTSGAAQALTFWTTTNTSGQSLTERLRISHDGNVGIGTTSPSASLEIDTATATGVPTILLSRAPSVGNTSDIALSSNSVIRSEDSLNHVVNASGFFTWNIGGTDNKAGKSGASEVMRIDTSGRLLINTSTAIATVDHSNNGFTPQAQVAGQGGLAAALLLTNFRDNNSVVPQLVLQKARGNYTTPIVVNNNDTLGAIDFNAYDGSSYLGGAIIKAEVDGTPGANEMPGRIVFSTNPGTTSATPQTRMTIKSDGNVGIGTTEPLGLLNVSSGASVNTISADADELFISNDGNAGMTIGASTNSKCTIAFAEQGVGNERGKIVYDTNDESLQFFAADPTNERVRIDNSGRLLVGTSTEVTPSTHAKIQAASTGGAYLVLARNDTSVLNNNIGVISFYGNDDDGSYEECAQIACVSEGAHATGDKPSYLSFQTTASSASSPTERMRITNDGRTGIAAESTNTTLIVSNGAAASASDFLLLGRYGSSTPLGGTSSFRVATNGDVTNTNDSYGAISDIKLKENIVDAESQWDDFKAVRFRKYNFKEETGHETFTQLGVIAQELELVSPGLVTETPDVDEDGNDLGTTTKSVKYSVLTKKALVALQEAMERIETLEQRLNDAGIA